MRSDAAAAAATTARRAAPRAALACALLALLYVGAADAASTPSSWGRGAIAEEADRVAGSIPDNGLQVALQFLTRYMPASDRSKVTDYDLVKTAVLAMRARRANAWAHAVPQSIWLNAVLPYRHLDEPYEAWRPMFHKALAPLVANATSLTEAAQIINREVWGLFRSPPIHFKPDQTPEIMSPRQVLAAGYASCTGLAIFLASACRSVGVPARVAGTPSWSKDLRSGKDRYNNHNWVEVWDGEGWSFTGACEYNPRGLNHTWFFPHPAKDAVPGSTLHGIYAASYQSTPGAYFPLAWAPGSKAVPGEDVTRAYLAARSPREEPFSKASGGSIGSGASGGGGSNANGAGAQSPAAGAAATAGAGPREGRPAAS